MSSGPSSRSRVVLVTGCSSGIGLATARRLADEGWPVVATARRVETLRPLAHPNIRSMALDVTDEASMRAVVDAIDRDHGAVGVLVNNAGYSQSGPVEEVPPDRVRRQFETNVFGPLRLTQLVLPGMRRQGWGRIVNLSSMGGALTFPGGGVYHATKYAVEALSDALRFEVRGFGVDVIVIQPGLIRTGFTTAAMTAMDGVTPASGVYAGFSEAVARATVESYVKGPVARFAGEPDDVARTIAEALAAPRPGTRYKVAPSAYLFMALRRWLGDSLWDRLLRRTYPTPGA
jgi:NAD(P)-dependent dehydrogenase (short-subunit alcohol dehydrogenase family)